MPWRDVTVDELPSKKEIAQVVEFSKRGAKPRFYADENFPSSAVRILRALGGTVQTVQERGVCGWPDEAHAAYALKHGLVLVSRDRDYLKERRFPLIHCPAIFVFDFGTGTRAEIIRAFGCLRRVFLMPQFFDKWTKVDATCDSWTESSRFLNGSTSRQRYRLKWGRMQEWLVEG